MENLIREPQLRKSDTFRFMSDFEKKILLRRKNLLAITNAYHILKTTGVKTQSICSKYFSIIQDILNAEKESEQNN